MADTRCKHCREEIELYREVVWIHVGSGDSRCATFATPQSWTYLTSTPATPEEAGRG